MATSLVSTGVQFPDATIQTTAASASPGATGQYSVVYGVQQSQLGQVGAFSIANLAAGNIPNQFLGFFQTAISSFRSIGAPKWSSYYQQWYTLMASYDASSIALFFSPNGLNWRVVIPDLAQTLGITSSYVVRETNNSGSGFAIDDSNGRFFLFYRDSSNFTLRYFYSSISNTGIPSLSTAWTNVNTGYVCEELNGAQYVKMSSTAASGIVVLAVDSTSTRIRVVIVSAGATANSLAYTALGLTNTSNSTKFAYEENGKIFVIRRGASTTIYNASNDIRSGWANLATSVDPSSSGGNAVGNGYVCYITGSNLYYGTGGAFTAVSVNGGVETLLNVFYTGSNFLVYGANGGLYISSNNTPVTWSVYNGIPSGGTRTILANSFAIGQRMTAS
jgi:hypothetical protein